MARFAYFLIVFHLLAFPCHADEAALRGYEKLTESAFLPSDFDQETFDQVWISWPEPLRSEAEKASPERRREMAFERYGLTTRPGDDLALSSSSFFV